MGMLKKAISLRQGYGGHASSEFVSRHSYFVSRYGKRMRIVVRACAPKRFGEGVKRLRKF